MGCTDDPADRGAPVGWVPPIAEAIDVAEQPPMTGNWRADHGRAGDDCLADAHAAILQGKLDLAFALTTLGEAHHRAMAAGLARSA